MGRIGTIALSALAAMTNEEIQAFGRTLLERLPSAILPKTAAVRLGDWQPQEHYCHDNVATWVAHNPEDKHVFGFVYFSFQGMLPYVRFAAHSVVERRGELYDITPHGVTTRYPFLRFEGTVEEFAPWGELGNLDIFRQR